jgi:glutathione S-transferase
MRLDHLTSVLSEREWLAASRFTVADILMADVLRVPKLRAFATSPVIEAYIERACARPAFQKAFSDQVAHFAEADAKREAQRPRD